jgi:hypothetical protein
VGFWARVRAAKWGEVRPESDGLSSDDMAPCDDESSLLDDVASEDSVVVRDAELLVFAEGMSKGETDEVMRLYNSTQMAVDVVLKVLAGSCMCACIVNHWFDPLIILGY